MHLSNYLKIWPYEKKPGYLLLFSTRKASAVLLKEEVLDSLKDGTLPPPDAETLEKLGIIVSDVEREKESVRASLERLNEKNACLNVTVVLNLDCNFACTYCYEGDMKGRFYMTEETGELLKRFIRSRFTDKMKFLNIDFYGGEPLLSLGLIKSISKEMKAFAESKGAFYTFTLITNGSLFRRKTAEELARLGLQSIKTTLDGPAEIHDGCRPFKTGAGSFAVIVENLKETWDIVKLGIGGNFQKDNYMRFPKLLDYLEKNGLTPEKIAQVKFDPVASRPAGEVSPTDFVEGCMSTNEPWLMAASTFLRKEILKRGYHTPKPSPMPCQVELGDYYVVNFDGDVYKCPAFIGRKKFVVGDLRTGMRDYSESHHLGHWKNEECLGCEYLPLCFGGCRYMKFLRDGDIEGIDCRRPYLDAVLETFVIQDIECRQKARDK